MSLPGTFVVMLLGALTASFLVWGYDQLVRRRRLPKRTGPALNDVAARTVREKPKPISAAVSVDPFTGERQETRWPAPPVRDIGSGRLCRLIFRSHTVFSPEVTEWTGTAAELIECLSAPTSGLSVLEEYRELPPPEILDRRLRVMAASTAHYMRVEHFDENADAVTVWRLSLNPAVERKS